MFVFDKNASLQAVDREYLPGIVLRIRPICRDEMAELRREAGRDDALLDKMILRRAVVDWPAGIVDPAGEKVPCTDEMKDAVFNRFAPMAVWAVMQSNALAELEAQKLAGRLKNSGSGHDGRSTDPTASEVVPPVS